jgi:hypothetical protein
VDVAFWRPGNTVTVMSDLGTIPETKKAMLVLSKKIKWIAPFKYEGFRLLVEDYPYLTCYTVTSSKASFSLIKLALMKAKCEFVDTGKYIIGKDCVLIAFKNEANEIRLIFDAN